jgi:hypothetical protein
MKKIILMLTVVLLMSFVCFSQIDVNVSMPKLGKNKNKDKDQNKDTKTNDNSSKDAKTTETKIDFPANATYDNKDNWFAKGLKEDDENLFCRRIDEVYYKVQDLKKDFESGMIKDASSVPGYYKQFEDYDYEMIKYYVAKARTVKKWGLSTDNNSKANDNINWFLNDMFAFFDPCAKQNIVPNVNYFIDKADEMQKAGKSSDAVANIKAAQQLCDGVLLLRPGQPDILAVMKDVKTFSDKIMANKEKVYTSEIHKKNAGKIVFSKTPIVIKQENESNFSSTFSGTDKIYAMAYLDGTFKEMLETDNVGSIGVHVFVDGDNESLETIMSNKCIVYRLPKDITSHSYLDFDILPELATAKNAEVAMIVAKILGGLSARSHTIGIQLSSKRGIAYGEFTIDLSQGQEEMKGMEAKYIEAAINNARMPEAAMKDPVLEATIKTICTNNSEFSSEGYKPQRVVLEMNFWDEQKDDFGNVMFVYTGAWVAYKKTDGTCEVVETFVAKDNKGGGQYGPIRYWKSYWSTSEGLLQIKCENVFKD